MNELSYPLNDVELKQLDHFLLYRGYAEEDEPFEDASDEGLLNISELDGYFTAIVSGPVPAMPSQWLPALWGDVEPLWESEQAFSHIFTLLTRHMNGIVNSLMDPEFVFEPLYLEREEEGRRITIVDGWCLGYLRGVALAQAQWNSGGEVLQELLEPISLFGEEAGWQRLKSMSPDKVELWQARVPSAARNVHSYWMFRREALPPQPVVNDGPRVGRNDPCPCGSGKKYKKCCLH